jgi:hypothetical protein
VNGALGRPRPAQLDELGEIEAVQQLHHVVEGSRRLADVDESDRTMVGYAAASVGDGAASHVVLLPPAGGEE